MSLQELLAVKIVREKHRPTIIPDTHEPDIAMPSSMDRQFHFNFNYIYVRFDGYLNGTQELSPQQILWSGPPTPRSNDQYPVVPTTIEQQVYSFELSYDVSEKFSLSIYLPYIHQSTEHISIVPGFSDFTIVSDGLGDIAAGLSWLAYHGESVSLLVGADLSFPTGSINEKGSTPRSATMETQLPYTMQLGSGTVDFSPAIAFVGWSDAWLWGVGADATIRLGENDRGYSLGNVYELQGWARYTASDWIQPSFRLTTIFWDKIHGEDTELLAPALPTNPYPAPVTNPNAFGGTKLLALPGLRLSYPKGWLKGQYINIEGGVPIYQYLNGPQPKEEWRISASISLNF